MNPKKGTTREPMGKPSGETLNFPSAEDFCEMVVAAGGPLYMGAIVRSTTGEAV